jgi:hypothetical protein
LQRVEVWWLSVGERRDRLVKQNTASAVFIGATTTAEREVGIGSLEHASLHRP